MTISNKYDVGFCVLTIMVVGRAHVIWMTKKMMENVLSVNFRERITGKSRSIYANDCFGYAHRSFAGNGQRSRIETGTANKA